MKTTKKDNPPMIKNKDVRTYSDFEKYEENPFLKKLKQDIPIGTKYKGSNKSLPLKNSITDQEVGYLKLIQIFKNDEQKFNKIFITNCHLFAKLDNINAYRIVFEYIMNQLKPNSDIFYFNTTEYGKITGYTDRSAAYDGLAALLRSEIIAKSSMQHIYYINPLVIFNGNRIKYIELQASKNNALIKSNNLNSQSKYFQ